MSWEVRTMQSKTSYFNATLFRKNLTRFWPLWGLASFIGALFPLAVLLDMVHRGRQCQQIESPGPQGPAAAPVRQRGPFSSLIQWYTPPPRPS